MENFLSLPAVLVIKSLATCLSIASAVFAFLWFVDMEELCEGPKQKIYTPVVIIGFVFILIGIWTDF